MTVKRKTHLYVTIWWLCLIVIRCHWTTTHNYRHQCVIQATCDRYHPIEQRIAQPFMSIVKNTITMAKSKNVLTALKWRSR